MTKGNYREDISEAVTRVSVVGVVGIPAKYGGFETLVENLVSHPGDPSSKIVWTVYCSAFAYEKKLDRLGNVRLRYVPLSANGVQSVVYDLVCMFLAVFRSKTDALLLLGVSGAIGLPLIRWFSSVRIVTNVDGIEWKREKWSKFASWFLRISEALAVKYSHAIVADNEGVASYLRTVYRCSPKVIAYGGDHALRHTKSLTSGDVQLALSSTIPEAFGLALCRIEPENNVHKILEAFAKSGSRANLVFMGNWSASKYGRELFHAFKNYPNLFLARSSYDPDILFWLRNSCDFYVHGHSAGGTNPSLLEMIYFEKPMLLYDCVFNRHTVGDNAHFFSTTKELLALVDSGGQTGSSLPVNELSDHKLLARLRRQYTWSAVRASYNRLLNDVD